MRFPTPAVCLALAAVSLANPAKASTLELATAQLNSNFPTCIGSGRQH